MGVFSVKFVVIVMAMFTEKETNGNFEPQFFIELWLAIITKYNVKMKINSVKIGDKFCQKYVGEIVVVKSYCNKHGFPCANCSQFRNGKQVNDICIELSLLYNPKWYTPMSA